MSDYNPTNPVFQINVHGKEKEWGAMTKCLLEGVIEKDPQGKQFVTNIIYYTNPPQIIPLRDKVEPNNLQSYLKIIFPASNIEKQKLD